MAFEPYSYKIVADAKKDIDEITEYITIALSNLDAARELIDEIQSKLEILCDLPEIGYIVENELLHTTKIRCIPVKNYLLYFFIDNSEKTINVLRVVYAKREQNSIVTTLSNYQ